ncbi:MAG TPA: phospholipase D-like domain-containing protein [Myxococcota bacterium]|jgi:phosphatidylserine/phosphatidylglycerophosphate/cardiolipin synthase-like enzyme
MQNVEVHFGGPDLAPGRLRDLLAERVAAVPAGGAIDFVTYYFRDRRLAAELLAARRRGAAVRVALDGRPRSRGANDAVIELLAGADGLGDGLRVVRGGKLLRPRLHEKLFCFSHPSPVAFVGSFNPSGDRPEQDPERLREIGDHDRGYNLLVELRVPELARSLAGHARALHTAWHGPFDRFTPAANRALRFGDTEVHFWPRVRPHPVVSRLRGAGAGTRVRLVTSHLSGPSALRSLLGLARRGLALEVLVGGTERRVPGRGKRRLAAAGISVRRVLHPEGLPMHDKFLLVEAPDERWVAFGSFNWTEPSRRFNREIGVIAREPALFDAFEARWEALTTRADAFVDQQARERARSEPQASGVL